MSKIKIKIIVASIATINATISNADPLEVSIQPNPEYEAPAPIIEIDKKQMRCLAKNIYFEARTETLDGQIAVAHATINRVKSPDFPDTVCAVVKQGPLDGSKMTKHRCQFSWFCDGKADVVPVNDSYPEQVAWEEAMVVADVVANGYVEDNTNGSTYYHADWVSPSWNKVYQLSAKVDSHYFYRHY